MGQKSVRSLDKENVMAEIKAINAFYPELKLIKFSITNYEDKGYGEIINAYYKVYFSLPYGLNWNRNIIEHIKDFFKLNHFDKGLCRDDAYIILNKESKHKLLNKIFQML